MVTISKGNSKMGNIPSVSLPSVTTCRSNAPCFKLCYANRFERMRPSVHMSYVNNYNEYKNNPDDYWEQVERTIKLSRFFRFHVAGDIPDIEYLKNMIAIAKRNNKCDMICFTKKYEIVNTVIQQMKTDKQNIPKNLHLIMSVWRGLEYENPYNLPEAHIKYNDDKTTATKNTVKCTGNCTDCALKKRGCWTLKLGQQLIIEQH